MLRVRTEPECPPPLGILRKGSGGAVGASENSFNRAVLVPSPLNLFTPLEGRNKVIKVKGLEKSEEAANNQMEPAGTTMAMTLTSNRPQVSLYIDFSVLLM